MPSFATRPVTATLRHEPTMGHNGNRKMRRLRFRLRDQLSDRIRLQALTAWRPPVRAIT